MNVAWSLGEGVSPHGGTCPSQAGAERQDVEYHLSHVCTKLGIASRTALIGRLSDPGE
ncbi:hypothetical protein GCM10009733_036320 [Nonomuraea maheshkhaliensis]|uniref:HTH luxR-type domain-containing protein n=1 Tax=Nonomuraea maheshkhaliensis TaxID=419590 RepID=A0ABP4R4I0_9ACTN